MATALDSDNEAFNASSESDVSNESTNDGDSDVEDNCQKEPCKYYNNSRCRDGARCSYWHICKYALKGNCKYGSSCKLNHPRGGRESSHSASRSSERSTSRDPSLTDGRYYQWQLNDGNGWMDVDNDHVIEAQFCLPHTKSIKIYNTPYGAVSIDFNRMRVYGKSLRVRRLDDGNTVWTWYCTLRRKWMEYGDKDSKGNPSPVKSSDIEQKFQSNPSGSITFTIGADTIEIKFREMRQLSKKRKRKVTRRPVYRKHQQATAGVSQLASGVQNISLGTKPQWQFEGDSGKWHDFKRRSGTSTECSVTSDDIERKYQQNPHKSMIFKVKGDSYRLDFRAMMQTNLKTQNARRIKRVLEDEEELCLREYPVSGKHYEWQLSDGRQWLKVDNDHVIELHYCQPGAKGISINTQHGQVFIDFDKLQTRNTLFKVRRQSFIAQGQTEDVGWYFRDDHLWREYGSQGSSMLSSSISSQDVERQFACNPQGNFTFTVGSTSYRLDFSNMTQTNCITGLSRKVRRRPKFPSSTGSLYIASVLPHASSSQLTDGGYKWEFMGNEWEWIEYQAHICSFDSTAIEAQYQLNPVGQLHFKIKRYSYTLDFSKMCQTNNQIGTTRAVRRTFNSNTNPSQQSSSTTPRWQFQDIGGIWKDYSNGYGHCSISSQDIELQYQQDPSGTMMFTTKNFSYELNFSAMTQRNMSTCTTRSVRRVNQ